MKVISLLCITACLFVTTAVIAQEQPAPNQDSPRLLPNYQNQSGAVHVPYLVSPQQEAPTVPDNTYQRMQNGTRFLPWSEDDFVPRNVRVELNLNRTPIQEALKKLFTQVKMDFNLEQDVPKEARITLRLKNVTFLTALNALTEEANVGWTVDITGSVVQHAAGKYRIGKSLSHPNMISVPLYLNGAPYLQQNMQPNYWNVQPGIGQHYHFNLYYNPTHTLNLNGSYNLQPNNLPLKLTTPNIQLNVPLNYNLDIGSSLSLENVNTIILPQNYNLTAPLNVDPTHPHKQDSTQGAPDTDPHKVDPTKEGIPVLKDIPLLGRLFTIHRKEERSIFTCPHCHNEITIIKQNAGGHPTDWKFCPICGQKISAANKNNK